MPWNDVSDMVFDQDLADTFKVTRRLDVISSAGLTTPTTAGVFHRVPGVVTQQDPSDLMRLPDGQMVPRRIFIATMFSIRPASTDPITQQQFQPDIITWNDLDYVVTSVMPYPRFGRGVYEVVAQVMEPINTAQ